MNQKCYVGQMKRQTMAVEMQIGRISSHLAPLSTGDVEQLSGDAFYEAYNSIFIIQRAGGEWVLMLLPLYLFMVPFRAALECWFKRAKAALFTLKTKV